MSKIKSKYTQVGNALRKVVKSDPRDMITVEIGDTKQPDTFYPQVKICRWGDNEETNEVNLSVRLQDDDVKDKSPEFVGEKTRLVGQKKEIEFYDVESNEEYKEGAFKFEYILKEKPKSNKLTFSLQTKGLDFFYQSELTQEEKDRGAHRPENVVGSYAVYHKTKRDNRTYGKHYKTGKFCHIYRPKLIDAEGKEAWGKLHIDVEKGLYEVTIPQDFLDKAVYPIKSNDTFGYESAGESGNSGNPAIRGTKYASGSAGTLTAITAYLITGPQSSEKAKVGIYDSDGDKVAEGTTEHNVAAGGTGWYEDSSFDDSISDTDYFLIAFLEDYANLAYDTQSGIHAVEEDSGLTYDTFPSSIDTTDSGNEKYSIYATYTAGEETTTSTTTSTSTSTTTTSTSTSSSTSTTSTSSSTSTTSTSSSTSSSTSTTSTSSSTSTSTTSTSSSTSTTSTSSSTSTSTTSSSTSSSTSTTSSSTSSSTSTTSTSSSTSTSTTSSSTSTSTSSSTSTTSTSSSSSTSTTSTSSSTSTTSSSTSTTSTSSSTSTTSTSSSTSTTSTSSSTSTSTTSTSSSTSTTSTSSSTSTTSTSSSTSSSTTSTSSSTTSTSSSTSTTSTSSSSSTSTTSTSSSTSTTSSSTSTTSSSTSTTSTSSSTSTSTTSSSTSTSTTSSSTSTSTSTTSTSSSTSTSTSTTQTLPYPYAPKIIVEKEVIKISSNDDRITISSKSEKPGVEIK